MNLRGTDLLRAHGRWLLFFVFAFSAWAQARSIPGLTGPVVEEVPFLKPEVHAQLNQALHDLYDQTQIQLGVLIVKNLEGEDINAFSIRVTDDWQLGKKVDDRGLLFLISAEDHKIRIEVGRGLEGDLPDILAKRIIDETMTPLFKDHRFDQGVIIGVAKAIKQIAPNFNFSDAFNNLRGGSAGPARPLTPVERVLFFIIMGFFVLLFITHPRLLILLLLTSGRGGGYGGGGGGREDGGWSGGGGGFSGGGASGGW
jgi:uncharacterized protein